MDTLEALKARVEAFTAENMALKAQITSYYNANCALTRELYGLRAIVSTGYQVADRNLFLEAEFARLEAELVEKKKQLADVERCRQEILGILRKFPNRR